VPLTSGQSFAAIDKARNRLIKGPDAETLPIPTNAPVASATVQTSADGTATLVLPLDPKAGSMFYRIDVED
jgi:hypothetical protein